MTHLCQPLLLWHGRIEAGRVVNRLATLGVEAQVRENRGMDPPPEDLTCRDPDGMLVQIQDVSYCGGSGVLGNRCD